MRTSHLMFLALLLSSAACTSREAIRPEEKEPVEEPLEEILSFGEEGLPEEYLLVRPSSRGIVAEDDGDILVLDEDWVKVFDPQGKPLTKFGGPGEGPGEFERVRSIWRGPNGYLTIFGGTFGFTAHYFRPDHSFIERVDYMAAPPYADILKSAGMRPERPQVVYRLSEDRLVYIIRATDIDRANREHIEMYLFVQEGDDVTEIARWPDTSMIVGEGMSYGFGFLGMPTMVPLSDHVIAYTHSGVDFDPLAAPPVYTIHIRDLDTDEERSLSRAYTPQPIEWEPREYTEDFKTRYAQQYQMQVKLDAKTADVLAEKKYMVGLQDLLTDGRYLFARTHTQNDSSRTLVDVFDPGSGMHLASGWMPAFSTLELRNGKAYTINSYMQEGIAPIITVHRIVPSMLGKDR